MRQLLISGSVVLLLFLPWSVVPAWAEREPFSIPPEVLQQARDRALQQEHAAIKVRRPEGLEDLSSPEAIQQVIADNMKTLGDPDYEVARAAQERLRYLGDEAYEALLTGLDSENPQDRVFCVGLLGLRGAKALPVVEKVLTTDPEPDVRNRAADALGRTYNPEVVPFLLDALTTETFWVRSSAISWLGYMQDSRAFQPLADLLNDADEDGQLREHAARSLLQIDFKAGEAAVQATVATEPDENLRHNLQVAIHNYSGGGNSWPAELLDVYQLTIDAETLKGEQFGVDEFRHLTRYVNDENPMVAARCIHALTKLGAEQAVATILEGSRITATGYAALARFATPEAVERILRDVQSPDPAVRKVVVFGFASAGLRWPAPLLIALLDDKGLQVEYDSPWAWEQNDAYNALVSILVAAGIRPTRISRELGGFDVKQDIERLQDWWPKHGDDFLAGKPVSDPKIRAYAFDS